MNVRNKVLVPVMIVLIIAFAGISIVSGLTARSTVNRIVDSQMQSTLESAANQLELTEKVISITLSTLDQKNLALSRALANLVSADPSLMATERMIELAEILAVDEVHVTDEAGLLLWGNIPGFYGFDFKETDQTRPFMDIINNPSRELAQEPTRRGTDGVMFQYVGVSRKDSPGVVQVGISVNTLDEIRNSMNIQQAIDGMKIGRDGGVFLLDADKSILADSTGNQIGTDMSSEAWVSSIFSNSSGSLDFNFAATDVYARYMRVDDKAIVTYIPQAELNEYISGPVLTAIVFGVLGAIVVAALLFILMERMVRNLNAMIREVTDSATQFSHASAQIADGAQQLAQGASNQSDTMNSLSQSINDISQKTRSSNETATTAAALSNDIRRNAETGSQQMEMMLSAVHDIDQASNAISQVIKTIDDIAFQTNILALNAAVEAARAGENGKSFSVVAEEVRNLAQRCAASAQETGMLISNTLTKTAQGVDIAQRTSASLNEIVVGVVQSSQLIQEIAQSSSEQNAAISQVNQGIDQVMHIVEQNNHTAGESAAASEEMSSQARMLEELMARFRLM